MSKIRDSDLSGLPLGQRVALRQAFPNLDPGVRAAAGDLSSIKAAIRDVAASQSEVVVRAAACDLLRRHGCINAAFFGELRQERPRRSSEINHVARLHGIA